MYTYAVDESRESVWCEVAYLTCASAKHLSEPLGSLDELLAADNDASHRGTDALGETEADGVKAVAILLEVDTLGGHGIKEPRPVEMHGNGLLASRDGIGADKIGYLPCVFEGKQGTA